MSEVAHDNWKRLKLYEDAGMIDWLYFYIIFICKWISFSSLCKIVRSSVILLLPEYVLNICHRNDKLPNINQPINQYWISLIIITNFLIHFNVTKCSEKGVVVVINSWSVISSRVTTDTGDTDTDDVCKWHTYYDDRHSSGTSSLNQTALPLYETW